jgi:hypothetical protein
LNKPIREGFVDDRPVKDVDVETLAPPPPEPAPPEWPLVVKLRHKPVKTSLHEEVHELSFREPTAYDIIKCGGNPCKIEIVDFAGGTMTSHWVIDDRKMMVLMSNLSGISDPFLQRMDPRDYNSCAHRLGVFFLPDQW